MKSSPITSCIGSPPCELSKKIAWLISPLSGQTDLHVKGSKHVREIVKNVEKVCIGDEETQIIGK